MRAWKDQLVANAYKFDFPIHTPFYQLTAEQKRLLWRGNEYFHGLNDFFAYIDSERRKIQFRVMKARYTGKTVCPDCGGSRLRKEALYVRIGGKTIADLVVMPVETLADFFASLELDAHDTKTAARILTEIRNRLQYLMDVGLGYLTLDRLSSTLSGGESQRINLSTSLGSNLVGSLYILDEPSIGLHPRDTNRLVGVLEQLRDIGNTVIVVEHEEEVIRAADWIVDIGPEAGYNGGEVVFSGPLKALLKEKKSLTADYLTGRRKIAVPTSRRSPAAWITVKGARQNNLKNIDVRIPLGVMTCITGVSGSGKSSLAKGILYPALRRLLFDTGLKPGVSTPSKAIFQTLRSVEMVDQNPIGKSSRSNPVTYIKPTTRSANSTPTSPTPSGRDSTPRTSRSTSPAAVARSVRARDSSRSACSSWPTWSWCAKPAAASASRMRFSKSATAKVDLRRTGDDGGRCDRLLRRGEEKRHLQTDHRTAPPPAGGRVGVYQTRTVLLDAFGRRESAREARVVPVEGEHRRQRDVHLRRATTGLHFHDINKLLDASTP